MKSLRTQFIVSLVSLLSIMLGLAGWTVYTRIQSSLYADADAQLVQRLKGMVSQIEVEGNHLKVDWLEEGMTPPGHMEGMDFFTLWNTQNGEILLNRSGAGGFPLPKVSGEPDTPQATGIFLPNEQRARAVGITFHPSIDTDDPEAPDTEDLQARVLELDSDEEVDPPALLLVVARKDAIYEMLETLRDSLLMVWGGFIVLGGGLGAVLVGFGLSPISQLKRQIQSLQKGVSGQRIELARTPEELLPVVKELNQLLDNVERALVRERLLTSNVAHELRNPIAGLLSILEVTLGRLRSTDEYVESTEECFDIAKRMHWLVNNLLSIARIESGNVELMTETVLVAETLKTWWEPFDPVAKERCLSVSWEVPMDFTLKTDPEFLRVVVTNLFDNAVTYTPSHGDVRIRLDAGGHICIANQTMDLEPEIVERVFDPFWRRSESRENPGAHAGLGLNLCRKIIELLGGRIDASVAKEKDMFEVRFQIV